MERTGWSPGMSRSGSGAGSAAGGTRHGLRGRSLASLNAGPEGSMRAAATAAAQAQAKGAAALPAEPFLQPQRRPSTLQLLSSAAKAYLEGSSHGGRSQRGSAAAALAAGSSSHGGGAARQVADDSTRGLARRQQAAGLLLPMGTLPDGSTSSCSSASSRGLAGGGALAGAAGAVQIDREASEGRQRGTMIAALAAGVPHEQINAMLAMRSGSLPSSVGSPAPLHLLAGSTGSTVAGTPARTGSAPRPASIAHALEAAAPAAPVAPTAPAAGGSRTGSGLDGLLPHRVVQRRSLENPLVPSAAAGGCCCG